MGYLLKHWLTMESQDFIDMKRKLGVWPSCFPCMPSIRFQLQRNIRAISSLRPPNFSRECFFFWPGSHIFIQILSATLVFKYASHHHIVFSSTRILISIYHFVQIVVKSTVERQFHTGHFHVVLHKPWPIFFGQFTSKSIVPSKHAYQIDPFNACELRVANLK